MVKWAVPVRQTQVILTGAYLAVTQAHQAAQFTASYAACTVILQSPGWYMVDLKDVTRHFSPNSYPTSLRKTRNNCEKTAALSFVRFVITHCCRSGASTKPCQANTKSTQWNDSTTPTIITATSAASRRTENALGPWMLKTFRSSSSINNRLRVYC